MFNHGSEQFPLIPEIATVDYGATGDVESQSLNRSDIITVEAIGNDAHEQDFSEIHQYLIDYWRSLRLNTNGTYDDVAFYCHICFDNHLHKGSFVLESCPSDHTYCIDCYKTYVKSRIDEGRIDISCPYPDCTACATMKEIEELSDPPTFAKFNRFKLRAADPSYRECGACQRQIHFDSTLPAATTSCECGTINCFTHSNAHPNETCVAYEKRQEQKSSETIKRTSRKCPRCGANTEKSRGCNHMTCRCGMTFTLHANIIVYMHSTIS